MNDLSDRYEKNPKNLASIGIFLKNLRKFSKINTRKMITHKMECCLELKNSNYFRRESNQILMFPLF